MIIYVCCNCGEVCLTCFRDLSPELSAKEPVSMCCHAHFIEQDLDEDEDL